jgi:hypothetical protein
MWLFAAGTNRSVSEHPVSRDASPFFTVPSVESLTTPGIVAVGNCLNAFAGHTSVADFFSCHVTFQNVLDFAIYILLTLTALHFNGNLH